MTQIRPGHAVEPGAVRSWVAAEVTARAALYRRTTHDDTHVTDDQARLAAELARQIVDLMIAADLDPMDVAGFDPARVLDVVLSSARRHAFTTRDVAAA